jgi:hypothetical protein
VTNGTFFDWSGRVFKGNLDEVTEEPGATVALPKSGMLEDAVSLCPDGNLRRGL